MNERSKERTYSDEEVKERLRQELPHWYLEGGWIAANTVRTVGRER
jgi:hypothetical protein